MKFKHTFHVFVDNFSATYKMLLYRLVIWAIAAAIYTSVIYPFVHSLIKSEQFQTLWTSVKNFFDGIANGETTQVSEANEAIKKGFKAVGEFIAGKSGTIAAGVSVIVAVHIIQSWFSQLGNYAAAAVINDKMALQASSPFLLTLIHNLKSACLYALIYTPLSLLYNAAVCVAVFFFVFYAMFFVPVILQIFLFVLIVVAAIVIKMTFTADWLPALIAGKKKQGAALKHAFSRKGKHTLDVLSNFVVLVLLIFGINFAAAVFTFGVGVLLTIPASYVILLSFELVNYYDREEMKYFIDKYTIIKPGKEKVITREEFFRGEN